MGKGAVTLCARLGLNLRSNVMRLGKPAEERSKWKDDEINRILESVHLNFVLGKASGNANFLANITRILEGCIS